MDLQAAGFAYEEVDLAEHREALTRVKELTGQSTVPQVWGGAAHGGRGWGGADGWWWAKKSPVCCCTLVSSVAVAKSSRTVHVPATRVAWAGGGRKTMWSMCWLPSATRAARIACLQKMTW